MSKGTMSTPDKVMLVGMAIFLLTLLMDGLARNVALGVSAIVLFWSVWLRREERKRRERR